MTFLFDVVKVKSPDGQNKLVWPFKRLYVNRPGMTPLQMGAWPNLSSGVEAPKGFEWCADVHHLVSGYRLRAGKPHQ